MKKIITLFIALSFLSCNDGDFDVPGFEFTDEVYGCWNYILYVTSSNKTETMVMTLIDEEIGTEIGEKSYPISPSLEVVYRIFNEGIGTDYFCQAIPPTSPKVIKELDAASGFVNIITSEIFENNVLVGYSYEITILDLLFMDNNERIYFETFKFGTYIIML
jgi:hypothetical protein